METLRKYSTTLAIAFLVGAFVYYTGYKAGTLSGASGNTIIANQSAGEPETVDFAPFWRAWELLEEKYVSASSTAAKIEIEDKLWGSIKGLAASFGDPYTVFFPPVETEMFETDIRGNFEGVGMEVAAGEGGINVIAPLKGSPAERAGLLTGDKIVRIDNTDATDLSTEEAVRIIRGPKGTSVKLTVLRKDHDEPISISVTRDVINIPTINTEELPGGVFLIELYSFTGNSPALFRSALREFVTSSADKLVLDLRGNPGGYLEAALDMASWFLPSGKVVLRENFGPDKPEHVYRSRGYDIFNDNLKFVILVDSGSASAAEILAGALAENGKAVLVGETTFGKGSVQELVNVTPETTLKITIAQWLTPSGKSISATGIKPDYEVLRTQADRQAGRDPQLDKALEILRQ